MHGEHFRCERNIHRPLALRIRRHVLLIHGHRDARHGRIVFINDGPTDREDDIVVRGLIQMVICTDADIVGRDLRRDEP